MKAVFVPCKIAGMKSRRVLDVCACMCRLTTKYLAFPLLLCALGIAGARAQVLPSQVDGQNLPTLANVVSRVENGIVNIATIGSRGKGGGSFYPDQLEQFFQDDSFFRRFFEFEGNNRSRPRSVNQGSGVIFDAERGYVLTNHHLLINADQTRVTLSDGRVFDAEMIGADPDMDLALLKIDADGLTDVRLGDSDDLRVGDFVLAIGNNYGLSATVTSGIVSALGRSGLAMSQYQDFIQTDAAINPGSSGGALVNLRGEIIGINTAILAPSGGNIGIGFAIPINTAASVAMQLRDYGRVKRGLLGIHFQELTEDMVRGLGLDHGGGVLINKVLADSAAAEAGLRDGDILTHVNGDRVMGGSSLRTKIALIRVGDSVAVKYLRDGQVFDGSGTIRDTGLQIVRGGELMERLSGAEFHDDRKLYAHGMERVVVVSSVSVGSEAWKSGIREGDVIIKVNRQSVDNIETFESLVEGRVDGNMLMLEIVRGDEYRFIVIG